MLSSDFHLEGTEKEKKFWTLCNTFFASNFTLITHFIFLFEVIDDMPKFLKFAVLEDKKNSELRPFFDDILQTT